MIGGLEPRVEAFLGGISGRSRDSVSMESSDDVGGDGGLRHRFRVRRGTTNRVRVLKKEEDASDVETSEPAGNQALCVQEVEALLGDDVQRTHPPRAGGRTTLDRRGRNR